MSLARALPWLALVTLAAGCQEYAEPSLTPAQKKKVEAHLLAETPTPKHPIGAVIEDQIKLIGYDLDKTEAAPGDRVTITYYLEVLAEQPADNKIFVHFQGRKNDPKAWMNLDHHPIEGLWALRKLKKGQIVKDVQTFKIREDFPGGEAKIYWGLFRGNHRLKITNAADVSVDPEGRVIVATVNVKGDPSKPAEEPDRLPIAVASVLEAGETITIDGKLDEPVWTRARPTRDWVLPNGKPGDAPATRARFAWDKDYLYVAVQADDADVWTSFTDRDSNTWEQEVIELFIDADGDRKDYLELQVTPANVIFDAKFATHRSDLATARAWNMEGLRTAALVDGTLNARDDTDKGYTVEMAIPVAHVPGATAPLAHGATWRVNLFRWDAPKDEKQKAAAFSPPVVGDFHALDRFGRLRFVDPSQQPRIEPRKLPLIQPRRLELNTIKPEIKLPGGGTMPVRPMPGATPSAPMSSEPPTAPTPAPAAPPPAGGAK